MLLPKKSPAEKRAALRADLKSGRLLRFPGAFSPLVAMAIERQGFEGAYISGAALSADLGLSDIGLTTLDEVAGRGAAIARRTALPAIIDTDTGFGEALNVARTVQTRWKRRGCAAVTSRTSRIRNAATTWTANHSCPPPTAGNCTWCAAPNRTAT